MESEQTMEATGLSRSISKVRSKLSGLKRNDESASASASSLAPSASAPAPVTACTSPDQADPNTHILAMKYMGSSDRVDLQNCNDHENSNANLTSTNHIPQLSMSTSTPPSLESNKTPSMANLETVLLPSIPSIQSLHEMDGSVRKDTTTHVVTNNDFADAMAQSILEKVDIDATTNETDHWKI